MRSLCLCIIFLAGATASAHPGRTDANGGHHDRKNGGYHYHGGGVSLPEPRATVPIEPRTQPRTTARTSARISVAAQVDATPPKVELEPDPAVLRAQEEARLAAERAEQEQREKEAAESAARAQEEAKLAAKRRVEEARKQTEADEWSRAKYKLHMSIGTVKPIADYADKGSTYYITTVNGGHVAYPKVMVKKIEPIERISTTDPIK